MIKMKVVGSSIVSLLALAERTVNAEQHCAVGEHKRVYESFTSKTTPTKGHWESFNAAEEATHVFLEGTFEYFDAHCEHKASLFFAGSPEVPDATGTPTLTPTTMRPTMKPTLTPTTMGPTKKKTLTPTTVGPTTTPGTPTLAPTMDVCSTAYVYCAAISKCFGNMEGISSDPEDWGWSIDVGDLGPGDTIMCPVYIGAEACNPASGQQIGEAAITTTSVTWTYKPEVGGMGFHMYGGICELSDAGMHLDNPGAGCVGENMAQWYRTPMKYSIVADFDETYQTGFYFDQENAPSYLAPESIWAEKEYNPFPLGVNGHRYIALQTTVCPCGTRGLGCSSSTASPTVQPTVGPTDKPTVQPTNAVTSKPIVKLTTALTSISTVKPTIAPTSKPAVIPTIKPTAKPTSKPTAKPTSKPTNATTLAPKTVRAATPVEPYISWTGQDTTYVYCEGLSECFIPTYSNAWGWNIDLSKATTNTVKCPIYAGAGQCERTTDRIVGYATITANSVKWDMFGGVGSEVFHMYAGKCPVNDGGYHLTAASKGECKMKSGKWGMGQKARTPGSYTLVSPTYTKFVNAFEYNKNNSVQYLSGDPWVTDSFTYQVFPLAVGPGGTGNRYISLHGGVNSCGSGCA